MKLYWCLLIVLYINKNAGDPTQEKEKLSHSQVAIIQSGGSFLCGGDIISVKWVMCFEVCSRYAKKIVFGSAEYNKNNIVNYVKIPEHNIFTKGKLALLKIDNENFTNYVNASHLKLPDQRQPSNDQDGWLIGWQYNKNESVECVVMENINVGKFYGEIKEFQKREEGTVMIVDNVVYELLHHEFEYINIFDHILWIKRVMDEF